MLTVVTIMSALSLAVSFSIMALAIMGKFRGKRGRPGKDGANGIPGPQGLSNKCCATCPEGKAGECYVWKPWQDKRPKPAPVNKAAAIGAVMGGMMGGGMMPQAMDATSAILDTVPDV